MKVLIASGGTGGHLYPALVLAKKLKEKNCEVLFALRANASAPKGIVSADVPSVQLESAPLYRANLFKNVSSLFINLKGFMQCLKIVKDYKPDLTAAFGGYASVPAVLASYLRGVPVLVHEQNSVPGLANKICALFAKKVAVSFEETLEDFSGKGTWIGNPVREDIFKGNKTSARQALGLDPQKTTVLIFGGSAGAKAINKAVESSLKTLARVASTIQFIHQAGNSEETTRLDSNYRQSGFQAVVRDYFQAMGDCYHASDLVIARSGAGTIFELIAVKKPAILIPYPHSAGGHQIKNAQVLERAGCAKLVMESPELSNQLTGFIQNLTENPQNLARMQESYGRFPESLLDAPNRLADLAMSLAKS
ncbi:MAG: undecaprenyldiphospho-muramoylpentapeptide beta-N-acetylglucosaminyltransferase [Elusimicrobia bacterium RIFCSPLOWO2_01_FULL_54_10]|nr:MAG: undecaprenyldiphospho-muramoylpentapeptide beta-N-acetylglucosaminyltransferase [Elusimicrobia bacterium RIFCSPLOWO2_01_FULL_54_10]